jgi:hypothetical protein
LCNGNGGGDMGNLKRSAGNRCVCTNGPCGGTTSLTSMPSSGAAGTPTDVNVPAIAGGVGAAAFASLLVVALAIFTCRKRRQREQPGGDVPLQSRSTAVSQSATLPRQSEYDRVQLPTDTASGGSGTYGPMEKNQYESASSPLGDQPRPSSGGSLRAGVYASAAVPSSQYGAAPPAIVDGDGSSQSLEAGVYAVVSPSNDYDSPNSPLT